MIESYDIEKEQIELTKTLFAMKDSNLFHVINVGITVGKALDKAYNAGLLAGKEELIKSLEGMIDLVESTENKSITS